jgi:hypothetical protein
MDLSKLLDNLTEEQIAKAKKCKTQEEFMNLVGAEGIDLTEEQMDAFSGGFWCSDHTWGCPADGCNAYRFV